MSSSQSHSVFFENDADGTTVSEKPAMKSNVDLINECDSFPYPQTDLAAYQAYTNSHYHLLVPDHITSLGLVLPAVAEVFRGLPSWEVDDDLHTLTLIAGNDRQSRSAAVAATTAAMRATGYFEVLKGWRDELYPVFGEKGDVLFDIERSASPLFGVVTYGCHLTAFVRQTVGGREALKVWVPRRARHKQTYGGMLDNTVAGGLSVGETPMSCLVRESAEEASLPEQLLRDKVKAAGTVSYFHIRDKRAGGETSLLQPECQYVYDLELSEDDPEPKIADNEVESFELMGVEELKHAMAVGEFKPNCALVLLDFFVRHGLLAAEEEKDYSVIVARLHRLLEFPTAKF